MASSGNFATWNRAANVNPSLSYSGFDLDKGNIRFRGNTGGTSSITSSLSMPSGKWYIEIYTENNAVYGWPVLGVLKTASISKLQDVSNYQSYTSGTASDRSEVTLSTGNLYAFGSTSGSATGSGQITDGDIVQIAVDIDAGKWWFGKNNTYTGSGDPAGGSNATDTFTAGTELSIWTAGYNGSSYLYINAGQDSTFSGNVSAGGNADDNGFGDFKYAPPSGFLALCTGNLPISSDIDPAQTDSNYPGKQFNTVLYTGTGSSNAITGVNFQPDFVWLKRRDAAASYQLYDSSRGTGKLISSDANTAEQTVSTGLNSFDTDGFTLGTAGGANASGGTFVAWCWKANGGTTASNSNGSITSTVQANQNAGFSIVTTTGNGGNATIGHGLGAVPKLIFSKQLTGGTFSWVTYHPNQGADLSGGELGYMHLDHSQQFSDYNLIWNDTAPTSTVFSVGSAGNVNGNGSTYVHYCWSEIEGFSKFGGYVGGGNADGPFIYTGFRPRMLFIKKTSGTGNWECRDTARDTFNPLDTSLVWDSNTLEASSAASSAYPLDVLSNGFKIRTTSANYNSDGANYIYGAWGDVPFKYNNTF